MNPRLEEAFRTAAKPTVKKIALCWAASPLEQHAIWWAEKEDSGTQPDAQVATFDDAIAQLKDAKVALEKATSTRRKITELEDRIAFLESRRQTAIVTIMKSLACADIEVLKPISVTIDADGDDGFIASFMDAGVSSGGETIQEAYESLQSLMATAFRMLTEKPDSALGPKMLRQKYVLMEFLCRHSPRLTPVTSQES